MTLDPVKEFVTIDLWYYEDGRIGWKVKSNCNEEMDREATASMMLELAESILAGEKDQIVASMYFSMTGSITTRRLPSVDFSTFKDWMWLKSQMHQAQWYFVQRSSPPRWRWYLWSLQFIWHKLRGHFKPRQTPLPAPHYTPPATVTEMLSERSTAVEKASKAPAGGGTVLPFPKGRQ